MGLRATGMCVLESHCVGNMGEVAICKWKREVSEETNSQQAALTLFAEFS